MKLGRIIIATVIIWLVHLAWGWAGHNWLFAWIYSLPPTIIWRVHLPLVLESMAGFIFAFFFVFFYAVINESLPNKSWGKGLWYGLFVWLIGWFPMIASFGMLTIVNDMVIFFWMANALFASLLYGLFTALIWNAHETTLTT